MGRWGRSRSFAEQTILSLTKTKYSIMNNVGILVRVAPEALTSLVGEIEALPGATVYSVAGGGCLSVKLQRPECALLAEVMVSIQHLEGVLSTELLSQQYDDEAREC